LGEFGPAGLIPEGELDTIPESELVVDNAEVVLNDVFGGANLAGNVAILESLGNEFDDAIFAFTGDPVSVAFDCKHSCLL
jgi:hypothetical protein